MKNTRWIFFALLCTLFWLPLNGFSQADDEVENARLVESDGHIKNIVKISPFHFADGTFLLSYEHMLSENKSSLMFSAGLHSRTNYNRAFGGSGTPDPDFGFQEEFQYRIYVIPPQDYSRNDRGFWYFKGFYAGPYLKHRYLQRTVTQWDWVLQVNTDEKENINQVAGGVLLGVQFAIGNRFFMDFYTGGGVQRSFGEVSNQFISVGQPGYSGVVPQIGFQIGIGL